MFYTVGLGIGSGNAHTFARATLAPSASNVAALSKISSSNKSSYYNTSSSGNILTPDPEYLYALLTGDTTNLSADSSGRVVTLSTGIYTEDTRYDGTSGGDYSNSALKVVTNYGYPNLFLTAAANNPYADDYNYCDWSCFDGDMSSSALAQTLSDAIARVNMKDNYSYLLAPDTNLTMTDTLGAYFEVKGTPVLRYNGVNYAAASSAAETDSDGRAYTAYTYGQSGGVTVARANSAKGADDQTRDLSAIVVKVYTPVFTYDSAGAVCGVSAPGKVVFSIPADEMPTFYPNRYKEFYFDELPVRLIYRVGVGEGGAAALNAALDSTRSEVNALIYTNSWSGEGEAAGTLADAAAGTGASDTFANTGCTVTFTPHYATDQTTGSVLYNPYYLNDDGSARVLSSAQVSKANNVSSSASTSFAESVATAAVSGDHQVTQTLGNNGVIRVSREALADESSMVVKKVWESAAPEDLSSVDVVVYKCAAGTRVVSGQQSVTVAAAGTDAALAACLTADETQAGNVWVGVYSLADYDAACDYYVAEQAVDGFAATYKILGVAVDTVELTLADGSTVAAAPVSVSVDAAGTRQASVSVYNAAAYTLPDAGGPGAGAPVAAGCALVAVALCGLAARRRTSRKMQFIDVEGVTCNARGRGRMRSS
jgi:hypothetical protein